MNRFQDDLRWLVPPVVAGCIVYLVYLRTNPYPAHGAGLYFTMARAVVEHDYALPQVVPFYTPDGIPFAYPPFAIYAIALVWDVTGFGPLAMSRWLPGLVVLVSTVPTYLLARELLDSSAGAAVVTTMVIANPQLLDWHLTAGGLVRAPAFLFATVGLYASLRRFRSGQYHWLVISIVCLTLTLLSHPTTTLFFVVSYLSLFFAFDRSIADFVDGVIVGVGALVLAAPWWSTVVRTHGADVFIAATGTHGGIGGGIVARLLSGSPGTVGFLLLVVAGLCVVVGVVTGWSSIVVWLLAVSLVLSQPRFALFVGTFLLVAVGSELVPESGTWRRAWIERRGPALAVAFAVVCSALVGAGYLQDDTAAPRLSVTPNHVDGTDLEAMEWARSETPTDAPFVVLGDAAEWFPLFAERTLLVSPWGAEWEGPTAYEQHTSVYRTVSWCDTARCLTRELDRHAIDPDYVYVPKDGYPVQGTPRRRAMKLTDRLDRSDRYVQVFENDGVTIFRRERAGDRSAKGERITRD